MTEGAMTVGRLPWRVEEACWNAFPSLQQVLLGNWLLRFGEGLTRRANSINPLNPGCEDIAAAIAAGEALYHAHDLPVIFRMPSIVDPALDRELAARGYTSEGDSCVLYGAIDGLAAMSDPAVRLWPSPKAEWLAAMARLQGHTPAQRAIYRRIVGAVALPARFALLAEGGAPAGLAYGAVHDGLLSYESVITDPALRRRGLAPPGHRQPRRMGARQRRHRRLPRGRGGECAGPGALRRARPRHRALPLPLPPRTGPALTAGR
jgi:N-acetylglutamate synthase